MKNTVILKSVVASTLALFSLCWFGSADAEVDVPSFLSAADHPKFINQLPLPARVDATSGGKFDVEMRDALQFLGIYDTAAGNPSENPLLTEVWGYGFKGGSVTYPGATFVAMKDVPVDVMWKNKLPKGMHLIPLDDSIHLVDPIKKTLDEGNIPVVPHLHGGHTESASDGLPEAWFTQGWAEVGPYWVKKEYHYDNDQVAATLWYHDHALGITRLNVYAGLAGFYLLRDAIENTLVSDNVIPSNAQEFEIVIQDRRFDGNGQLILPTGGPEDSTFPDDLLPIVPFADLGGDPFLPFDDVENSIIAEFFGDFILVNGMAWPFKNVGPYTYRFRLLNGSDSRFYVLEFRDEQENGTPQSFLLIGTEDGLLGEAVSITQLVLAPGERADIVVDFSTYEDGTEIFLRNFGPDEPFKGLDVITNPAEVDSTGQIMKFVVDEAITGTNATVDAGTPLNSVPALEQNGPTRRLALFEGRDEFGRLQPLLGVAEPTAAIDGNILNGSLGWFNPITEWPMLNDVEVWEVYNATEDAHPIHLHLVAFQILNRQEFEGDVSYPDVASPQDIVQNRIQFQHDGTIGVGGILKKTVLVGDPVSPPPSEAGLKDTVIALPGQVTRVIAKFDRTGRYVWHCHILSHEDHEMMRPYEVVAPVE